MVDPDAPAPEEVRRERAVTEELPVEEAAASTRAPTSEVTEENASAAEAPVSEAEHGSPIASGDVDRPELAEGIELVGRYEGSGYKKDPYIARRADGQMIQLSELLYLVAESVDGSSDLSQIAASVSDRFGKSVSEDNVRFLIDEKLRPLGILVAADGSSPKIEKADPLLALKFKKVLLPERGVGVVAALLKPLFWPPVVLAFLAGLVAVDVWYFSQHGIGQSMRDLLYSPLLILAIYGLLIVSISWHEFGHATACRYGGAKPGVIGFGIYVVWPAFYCDVTDAYRLSKGGRVRTDLGGIYYNGIFSIAVAGVYFLTRFEPLLILILLQHMLMIYNFVPFLRMDGYYVVADATGVPDLFARVKPTLKSLVPGQDPEDEVTELKRWVRVVVTAWVLIVVPLLLFLFAMMVLSAPRVIATGWDSFQNQAGKLGDAWSSGRWADVALGVLQVGFLVLPLAGMSITIARVFKKIIVGAWGLTDERPMLRALTGVATAACLGFAGFVLWPNGEYKPIQPGERWTAADGFTALTSTTSGRPSLTEEREREFGGAPGIEQQETGTDTSEAEQPQPDEGDQAPADQPVVSPAPEESGTDPTPTPEATP